MERIFCNNLRKILYQHVKGSISAHIIKDTLLVDIEADNMTHWRYTHIHMKEKIINGLSSEYLANEIVKQYKSFIMNRYFFK